MSEVVKFEPRIVGDGFKVAVDDVLRSPAGTLSSAVVLGYTLDGELYIACTDGVAEAVLMIERAKAQLIE